MAIGFYQRLGTELRMIDYYESNDKPLKHYVEVLQQKTYKYGRHFAPHDIAVREFSTGKSQTDSHLAWLVFSTQAASGRIHMALAMPSAEEAASALST